MAIFSACFFPVPLEKCKLKRATHHSLVGPAAPVLAAAVPAGKMVLSPRMVTSSTVEDGDAASELCQLGYLKPPAPISIRLCGFISAITMCLVCRAKLIHSQIYLGNI